jgi:hypothetical protein
MIQAEVSIGFHGLAGELIVPDAQASRTSALCHRASRWRALQGRQWRVGVHVRVAYAAPG